jgi:ABC-type bacteriocin/lantibiotic exporter with double-glycine peptidase domain
VGLALIVPTILIPRIVAFYGDGLAGSAGLLAGVAIVGLILALLIQGALLSVQGILAVRMAAKVTLRLTSSMVFRLLRLPAAFHAQRGASVLGQRAVVADSISAGISALAITAAASGLTAIAGVVVLLFVEPLGGLVAVAVAVLMIIVVRLTLRRSRDDVTKVITEGVEAGALVSSALNQIEPIKASGSEDGIITRTLGAQYRWVAAEQAVANRSLSLRLLPGLIAALGSLLITFIAAERVLAGEADPGSLLGIIALASITIGPIGPIVVSIEQAQTLRAALDQLDDVLDTPEDPELARVAPADAPDTIIGHLQLRGVSFGYSPVSTPTVSDIDLDVPPGRRLALVGASGCGKSTVSRLVTGLYEPWTGEILIDGRPRMDHDRSVLTSALSLVDQDVTIFAGTIRDNVTLWDPSIPDEDVQRALEDAQLTADVARRPGGLDAVLLEGGADLSGGQRQRLELARALVRNPSILVLDEATSALDPVTELRIDTALRRRGITTLVIAHRLSTIRDSDEIVVLSGGRVIERGTHDELIERGQAYAALAATL